ncbi:DUF1492 domain-containing protein [Proteinivorax tanatarense]|uniref:DUF1492 domain-containing protein n=1 Tax=Proteinivorax tanatarense TaxID=1260629 RepID=A0AAU7VHR7_9FIRM
MNQVSESVNRTYTIKKEARSNRSSINSDSKDFHKTKLLLSIYRTVVWRVESAIYEINDTAYDYGGRRISELVDFLSFELDEYDSVKDKRAVEERLMCIAETKQMIEIIDKALAHLKMHPDNGQIYHDIIAYSYINKEKMCDTQIRHKLNLTQPTYYRYKKQATKEMGVALWGYIIPPLREYWDFA